MPWIIEHIKTGKRENVNDAQWESIQKAFPKSFRKISPLENYSEKAKQIIADADTSKGEEE